MDLIMSSASKRSVMLMLTIFGPNFRNNFDKLAFAVHASFLSSGFVLISTGLPAFADNFNSSSSSSEEVGIDGWNEVDDEYAFVYKNPKKGNKKVLLKCLVMNDNLMVDALSDGAPEPVHLEINVDEFATETVGGDYYDAHFKNLGRLVSNLESDVLSKLDGSPTGGPASDTSRFVLTLVDAFDPVFHFVPFDVSDLYFRFGAGMYPSRGHFGGEPVLIGLEDPRWFDVGNFLGFAGGSRGLDVPPGARIDFHDPPDVPEPHRRFPRGPVPRRRTRPRRDPPRPRANWKWRF